MKHNGVGIKLGSVTVLFTKIHNVFNTVRPCLVIIEINDNGIYLSVIPVKQSFKVIP